MSEFKRAQPGYKNDGDDRIKLGFLGCGNMAGGLLSAAVCPYKEIAHELTGSGKNSGFVKKGLDYKIYIYDVDPKKTESMKEKHKDIILCSSAKELAKECDYILLGIKPNQYKEALEDIAPVLTANKLIISIMAGVKTECIKRLVLSKVARTMPNLPITMLGGMTGICNNDLPAEDRAVIEDLFSRGGFFEYVDEDRMDAVTAISGSGPAYVFKFIDAMVKAGVKAGLSYDQAFKFTNQTVAGAAAMCMALQLDGGSLQEKIDAVCSKGGTTIEAIKVFDEADLEGIVEKAVLAALRRSKELSEQFK